MTATVRSAHATHTLREVRAAADRLAALLSTEHGALADFLLALAAFDEARGWAELGHASLFDFLHRRLGLSRGAVHYRGAAARLALRHAAVAEALREGRLCLSSVAELAKVLTTENEAEVLPRFFRLSAREAKEVAAELQPHSSPPRREVVQAIAAASGASAGVCAARGVQTSELALAPSQRKDRIESAVVATAPRAGPSPEAPLTEARPADEAVPLTADLRRLHVTVSRRFLQKLEAAKGARAHARPGATTEAILEEALDLLIAREEKRRTAATSRPRRSPSAEPSASEPASESAPRHRLVPGALREAVPAQVRREVWARDRGRCIWPLDGGGTCGSTHRLQVDHGLAAARGGPPTVANLRVLCEAHNKEAARRVFGARWMERAVRRDEANELPRRRLVEPGP